MKNLTYKSIDGMKLQKDNCTSQPTDATIAKIVASYKLLNVNYVAMSVPMNFPDYALRWCNAIHNAGLGVIFRSTWNEIEGLYGATKQVGTNRPPDTINYWINKTKTFITSNPGLFKDGDLWAPLPERTENIFQDSTSFLPGPLPDNYAVFFNGLVDASVQAFTQLGIAVKCGFTANNWTEVNSGWIPQSLFDKAGITAVDHYGSTHTTDEMYNDLKAVYTKHGKKVFEQEWGNYWNGGSVADAQAMFDVFTRLNDEGILVGFNYWGGWPGGQGEGVLNADYSLNAKGNLLASYYAGDSTTTTSTTSSSTTTSSTSSSSSTTPPLPSGEQIIQVYGSSTMVVVTNKGNLWRYYNSKWTKLPLPAF